jgi:hypothetical protein
MLANPGGMPPPILKNVAPPGIPPIPPPATTTTTTVRGTPSVHVRAGLAVTGGRSQRIPIARSGKGGMMDEGEALSFGSSTLLSLSLGTSSGGASGGGVAPAAQAEFTRRFALSARRRL